MYEVVMSICDPVLKDQVCNHEDHGEQKQPGYPRAIENHQKGDVL